MKCTMQVSFKAIWKGLPWQTAGGFRPLNKRCVGGRENDSGSVSLHLVQEDIYTGEPKQHRTYDENALYVKKGCGYPE